MGTVGTPELVAAVSNAGGHGMLAAVMLRRDALAEAIARIKALTQWPWGVNFLVPLLDQECVDLAAQDASLVEFSFGDPDPDLVHRVHDQDALASWQVGSVQEARAAERAGCDVIVVQGCEAGGRIRGEEMLLPLLSKVLDFADVPVVAAGGIASNADVRAVLDTGAAGARVGTRFIAAQESGAHPLWVEALIRAEVGDTVVTDRFSELWPLGPTPHRVLKSCLEAAERAPDNFVGAMAVGKRMVPLPRFAAPAPGRDTTGTIEAMALYAGEGVGEVKAVEAAKDIVRSLCNGVS
jgi:nitronate monooxygenase